VKDIYDGADWTEMDIDDLKAVMESPPAQCADFEWSATPNTESRAEASPSPSAPSRHGSRDCSSGQSTGD
jgi:hypothetical protein